MPSSRDPQRVPAAQLAAAYSTWIRFDPAGYPGAGIIGPAIRNLGLEVVVDSIEQLGSDGALTATSLGALLRKRSNAALARMRKESR